jgi:hypothetical protein
MSILAFIGVLVAVGVVLWAVNKFGSEFIDGNILKIINIVVIIAVVLWVVSILFGFNFDSIRIGRVT